MHRPRALLIGANGQVGWELRRALAPLFETIPVQRPDLDLTNVEALRRRVQLARPHVIINAAAYTAVDKAESEPDLAMAINAVAPAVLAEEARQLGAWLVHYSTDYVYDGTRAVPYSESDPVNPLNVYGRSKLAGDEAIQRIGGNHLIFRLCWVYALRGRNFLLTIQRLAREKEQLRVVADQFGSPTWARLIAEVTALALKQAFDSGNPSQYAGLYHLACSQHASWHEFAEAIVAAMPPESVKCRRIEAIPTADYPTPARRPAASILSCDKLQRTFGLRLPDWKESLQLALDLPA